MANQYFSYMKRILTALCFIILPLASFAQTGPDATVMKDLNTLRLQTNKRGMTVLTAWGAANTITGAVGYFTATDKEWKAFHGMNAIWGITNAGLGLMGRWGVKRELAENKTCGQMLHRYEADKRLFLINGGLDFLYIGTGVYLRERSRREAKPEAWKGFGNSILMQGIFLLLFDGTMYASHQSKDKKWSKALEHICLSDAGVGFIYKF
jgi:hypothetical protein